MKRPRDWENIEQQIKLSFLNEWKYFNCGVYFNKDSIWINLYFCDYERFFTSWLEILLRFEKNIYKNLIHFWKIRRFHSLNSFSVNVLSNEHERKSLMNKRKLAQFKLLARLCIWWFIKEGFNLFLFCGILRVALTYLGMLWFALRTWANFRR